MRNWSWRGAAASALFLLLLSNLLTAVLDLDGRAWYATRLLLSVVLLVGVVGTVVTWARRRRATDAERAN